MSTEHEVSYGGVVVRDREVIVIVPRGRRRVLGLPKGGRNAGESPEQTAAREVREETGITARVRKRLGQVDYSYRRTSTCASSRPATPPTTTTRSTTRAGCRWRRRVAG